MMSEENEQLRQRVAELEQTVAQLASGGMSRRTALKGIGVAGAASLLGAGTASADSHTNDIPNVGSPDNPIDVFAGSVETDSLSASGQLEINEPTNLSNLNVDLDNVHAIKGSPDDLYTLILQMGDDQAGEGEPGYAATLQFVTESGQRIATSAADKFHNHWGVYTRTAGFDGEDELAKRLSVGGGSSVDETKFLNTRSVHLRPETSGHAAYFRAMPEPGDDCGLTMHQGTGDSGALVGQITYDASAEAVHLVNYHASGNYFISLAGTGEINTHSRPQVNFVNESGSSSNRPADPTHGQQFFDDTLGRPVWYDGKDGSWVDATGSPV